MPGLTFTVDGVTQLSRNLRVTIDQIQHPADFFQDALTIIEARVNQVFAEQGQSLEHGPAWPALAPSTQKARDRRWGYYKNTPSNPSILRWTGNLQDNRTKTVNDDGGEIAWQEPYAIFHQRGDGGKPPQRMFVDVDNLTAAEVMRALQTHLNRETGIFGNQA